MSDVADRSPRPPQRNHAICRGNEGFDGDGGNRTRAAFPSSKCEGCGATFEVPKRRPKQRFCTAGCARRHRPSGLKYRNKTVAERFWAKVAKGAPGECWEWTAFRDRRGYGRLASPGGYGPVLKAHRVSYEMHHGPIPEGCGVLHRCDNPPCVNPEHLYAGDQGQNSRDMVERGRQGTKKFSDEQVRAVRQAVADGMTKSEAARTFGISESQVHNLVTGAQRREAGGPMTHRKAP